LAVEAVSTEPVSPCYPLRKTIELIRGDRERAEQEKDALIQSLETDLSDHKDRVSKVSTERARLEQSLAQPNDEAHREVKVRTDLNFALAQLKRYSDEQERELRTITEERDR
jgi:predicted nuclease with TOPRIM domain